MPAARPGSGGSPPRWPKPTAEPASPTSPVTASRPPLPTRCSTPRAAFTPPRPGPRRTPSAVNRHHRGYIAPGAATDRASSVVAATPAEPERVLHRAVRTAARPQCLAARRPQPLARPAGLSRGCRGVRGRRRAGRATAGAGDGRGPGRRTGAACCPCSIRRRSGCAWLRYPRRPAEAPEDQYGSAPHTDFGCLTLLVQDDAGGLEVQAADGAWIPVPPAEGAILVNTGDIVPVWSGGRWRSTAHRVVNPPDPRPLFDRVFLRSRPRCPHRAARRVAAPGALPLRATMSWRSSTPPTPTGRKSAGREAAGKEAAGRESDSRSARRNSALPPDGPQHTSPR